MQKRKRKVYESEKEILGLIDQNDFELESAPLMAERCDREADEHYKWINDRPNPKKSEVSEYHERLFKAKERREEAKKHRQRMGTLRGKQILLKEKLAAMRTEVMPFMEGYVGVT